MIRLAQKITFVCCVYDHIDCHFRSTVEETNLPSVFYNKVFRYGDKIMQLEARLPGTEAWVEAQE